VGIDLTCQFAAAEVVVEGLVVLLDALVEEVVEPGVVVDVVVDDDVVVEEAEVTGVDELLLVGEATGVSGPGLTCSPAAATICHATTVVNAVASTQMVMRAGRLTTGFSQRAKVKQINRRSRFPQGRRWKGSAPLASFG
jgi:hypothetical protein